MNFFLDQFHRMFKMIITVFVMINLIPFIANAGMATTYTPLQEVRTIDRDLIKLSDVFQQIDPKRDQTIGAAPRPGQDMVLNARTLMKLAIAYQVKWQPTTTDDQITLRRDGVVIDAKMIEEKVKSLLQEQGAPDRFSLVFDTPVVPFLLPKKSSTVLISKDVSFDPETSKFHLSLSTEDHPTQMRTVTGKIEPVVFVPVAARTIAKGNLIGDHDIVMKEMKANQIKDDTEMGMESLVGLTARRNIIVGRTIKESDVEIPLSITRGDKVTLIYQSGVMELAAQGRALQDGRRGDRVKVVNTSSNKNLQGTVIADNRVIID